MGKMEELLTSLIQSIERRDGTERIKKLRDEVKELNKEGMMREAICQLLARIDCKSRFIFLIKHPGLVVPYICRIRQIEE
ncbi:MAG: hypothetical protein WC666_01915 [Candidatus Paceibacterota bacterium]|jgi:hypothetical protein